MKLYPDDYVGRITDYDFDAAYVRGKRAVLFDIDNTLVPHGAPADEDIKRFFGRLSARGFRVCAVSNNKEPRVRSFCEAVGAPYICQAGKPMADGYRRALKGLEASAMEAVSFGDQISTDIIGANLAGIESVLVRPVDRSTDEIQIKFKRIFEKPIIKAFFRSKKLAINDYFR